MTYAQIHLIFPIYEQNFYKLLVPYVLDELKTKQITSQKGKIMPADVYLRYVGNWKIAQEIIYDIAKKYFNYVFPEAMYKHLEPPKSNTNNSQTLAHNKSISNRHHVLGSTIYLKLMILVFLTF